MQKNEHFWPFLWSYSYRNFFSDAKLGLDKPLLNIIKLTKRQRFFMCLSVNLYSKILFKQAFLPFFVWNCYKNGKKNSYKIDKDEPRVNVYMHTTLKKYEFILWNTVKTSFFALFLYDSFTKIARIFSKLIGVSPEKMSTYKPKPKKIFDLAKYGFIQ